MTRIVAFFLIIFESKKIDDRFVFDNRVESVNNIFVVSLLL